MKTLASQIAMAAFPCSTQLCMQTYIIRIKATAFKMNESKVGRTPLEFSDVRSKKLSIIAEEE